MDRLKKQFAAERLLVAAAGIHDEIKNIKRTPEDDDLDSEYKTGAIEAFLKATEVIYEQVETLIGKVEQK